MPQRESLAGASRIVWLFVRAVTPGIDSSRIANVSTAAMSS